MKMRMDKLIDKMYVEEDIDEYTEIAKMNSHLENIADPAFKLADYHPVPAAFDLRLLTLELENYLP